MHEPAGSIEVAERHLFSNFLLVVRIGLRFPHTAALFCPQRTDGTVRVVARR